MAVYNVIVTTGRVRDEQGEVELAVALDFPTSLGWSDMSEQVDVPTDPDIVPAHGRGLTEAQYDALLASAYPVFQSEEVPNG